MKRLENKTFFIIAGAGKSGTSALAKALATNSSIIMSNPKEPRYFITQKGFRKVGGIYGPPYDGAYYKGKNFYHSLFDSNNNELAYGDASTAYFYCQETPELIYNYRPDTKIIMILRDPVDRIISQYYHEKKVGRKLPKIDDLYQKRNSDILLRYLWGSDYASHVKRYLKWFPSNNLFLIEYEQLFNNFSEYYVDILKFLEIPYLVTEKVKAPKVNTAKKPRSSTLMRIFRSSSRSGFSRLIFNKNSKTKKYLRKKIESVLLTKENKKIKIETINSLTSSLKHQKKNLYQLIRKNPNMIKINNISFENWRE